MTDQPPWARVKQPRGLPDFDHAGDLRDLDPTVFTETLRDHLIPRSDTGRYKAHWTKFWNVVSLDPVLSARADSYLVSASDSAKAELRVADLTAVDAKRAHAFIDRATMALNRLDRSNDEPLAWLGPRAADYNPRAREVIDSLVRAIDAHRRNGDDTALYAVLSELRLDPSVRH